MSQGIRHKINKLKFYFKLLIWAKTHSENVKNYRFLFDLRERLNAKYLEAERHQEDDKILKYRIQKELLERIINFVS